MSEEITLHIPISTLEDLRCSMCKGYLSCSPVCLLPDGKCICGRCFTTDLPIYRVLPLEAVLSNMSFPCNFKEYGCSELVLFEQAVYHEPDCLFYPFACPALTPCSWKGSMLQMQEHFVKEHSYFIKDSAEFMFKLDSDTVNIFMVAKQNVVFIIKYQYNSDKKELIYDVRYFMNEIKYDVSYKIQLINADTDCSYNLKTKKCFQYNNSFYDMQSALILNLNKFLESLDNPTAITVTMNLKLVKSSISIPADQITVDYDLLESLRCGGCKNYLIPPIYDSTSGTICYRCYDSGRYYDASPSSKIKLLELVEETYYPCRWDECTSVAKSTNIQTHELTCQFRRYHCVFPNCSFVFTLNSAADHLHCAECLFNEMFKTSFSSAYKPKYAYIILTNTLIAVKHSNLYHDKRFIDFNLLSDLVKITVVIHFEHEHCTLKSESFTLVTNEIKSIGLKDLPSCFKGNEEVSVVIDQWDIAH